MFLLLLLLSHFSCVRLCATHRQKPTRLPHPWDSPGKNTGVGCHFLLQCMKGKVKVKLRSHVRLLATPWTTAYQAPPSIGFSRREYITGEGSSNWSGLLLPSPVMFLGIQYFFTSFQYVFSRVQRVKNSYLDQKLMGKYLA